MKKTSTEKLKKTMLVIPSFQERTLLEKLVLTLDIPATQILVVGQGSTDGTEDFCQQAGFQYLQLTQQAGFAEACNAGIRWALEQKFEYIGICKNTTQLLTSVTSQLLDVFLSERSLGAVSSTQVVRQDNQNALVYRATWDLSLPDLQAEHKTNGKPLLLESDYCAFDFVLFPADIFAKIGFLDEAFEETYAAADFCFRLWKQGYRMVSHQQVQILCDVVSTPKKDLLQKNKEMFLKKHIQYGINYVRNMAPEFSSWGIVNDFFSLYFRKYGLIDETRPRLKLSHPASVTPGYYPYLFTVWETSALPKEWLPFLSRYEHIFLPSHWNYQVFQNAGCKNLSYVPLGFEPDIFHPWGDRFDFQCEKPFLSVCHNQYRKALDVTIKAWQAVKDKMPQARLFLFGFDIQYSHYLGQPDSWQWFQKIKRYHYDELRITFLEPSEPLIHEELAALYRGAHTFVLNSRSEGFGFPIIEAMGCGTLTIIPNYGATMEFISSQHCLALAGEPKVADYSDKGFGDVGDWWEPSLEHLQELLVQAYHMSEDERHEMTYRARQFVLTQFTWRQVALKMYNALQGFQTPKSTEVMVSQQEKRPLDVWCSQWLVTLGQAFVRIGEFIAVHGFTRIAAKRALSSIQRKLFKKH